MRVLVTGASGFVGSHAVKSVITSAGPLARPRTAYGRSKMEAERYVRGLQDDGAPVTVVYPGGVLRALAAAGHLRPSRARTPRPDKEHVMPVKFLQSVLTPVARRLASARWFAKIGPRVVPPLDRVLHRLSGGRILLPQIILPSVVLTTTGRRSGLPRETPLICMPEADGSFVVVGSNFGRDSHPAWTANLLDEPNAEVSYQGRRIPVMGTLLDDAERAEVWPQLIRIWSVYDTYVERADRKLRVFRLSPS
jgi:deazaflavin-dependent oxidoreductase (nitroreductase family)